MLSKALKIVGALVCVSLHVHAGLAAKDWEFVSYGGEALIVGRDMEYAQPPGFKPDPWIEVEAGYAFIYANYSSAIPSDTSGAVSVPSMVGGLPVTTIGKYAFCTCSNVTAITIPASVKHVAAGAFNGCKSLEKISVASGNTAYKIENGLLLTADGKRIVAAPRQIETVAIPAGVEYIDDYAFFGCGKITDVAIPEGVAGIGSKAFFGCKSLVRVSLPSTFDDFYVIAQDWGYWEHEEIGWDEEIGPEYKWTWEGDEWWEDHPQAGGAVYYPDAEGDFMPTDYNIAFGCCKSLLSIEVAAGNNRYKSVGGILSRKEDNAIVCFPGGLKTAEIKSPVATIGHCAFYGNLSLESLVIGESVKYVDSEAFLGCASLTNVVFKRKNAGDRIYFCDYGHFARCTSLERISLPEGMKNHHIYSIGGKGEEEKTFDDYSYPQIASSMFQHCHELKDVKLPDTLEGIDEYAFASCWKLEKIDIPANVTYLQLGAFEFCERLRTVDFKGKPDDVDLNDFLAELLETNADWLQWKLESVFGQTSWILSFTPFELEIEDGVLTGFRGCCPDELAIPRGVTEIGDSAFDYDENLSVMGLKKITLPAGLKRVGKWAFFWAGLEQLVIPEGVTELGEGAFLSCTNMTSLTLPNTLTALSPSALRNCGSLREIVIPKSIAELGERALAYCVGLEKIVFKGNAPNCGENAFLEINPDCTVYVAPSSTGWNVAIPGRWNGMRIEYDNEVPSWKVALNANGGVLQYGNSIAVAKGKAVGALESPTRDGYTFKGWFTKKSGGTKITAKTKVTKNVTYYAQWTAKKYKVAVIKTGKGTVSGIGSKAYKSKATLKAKAASGYVFQGWYEQIVPGQDLETQERLLSRKATYSFTVPIGGRTIEARFITKAADKSAIGLGVGETFVGNWSDGIADVALAARTNICGVVMTALPIATTGMTPTSVTVRGLPAGLKYDAAKKAITGIPSSAKTYTTKITVKSLGASRVWSFKWTIKPMPSFASGTFNGWTYTDDYEYDSTPVRKVTFSVTKAGKLSAKVGSCSFSRKGWTVDESGMYVANMRTVRTVGSGKKAKTYTDILSVTLDPDAYWTEDQLTGTIATFAGTVSLADALAAIDGDSNSTGSLAPANIDTVVSARRNPFDDKDNTEAKRIAAEIAAIGAFNVMSADELVWTVKVSAKTGVATISRTIGSGKKKKTVSATTVIKVEEIGYQDDQQGIVDGYSVSATFLVSGKIISFDL